MLKLRTGNTAEIEKIMVGNGENFFDKEKKTLIGGNGSIQGGFPLNYNGGNISLGVHYPKVGQVINSLAPSFHADQIKDRLLENGETVYCLEDDWLYVGDGQTKGGIKVAASSEDDDEDDNDNQTLTVDGGTTTT